MGYKICKACGVNVYGGAEFCDPECVLAYEQGERAPACRKCGKTLGMNNATGFCSSCYENSRCCVCQELIVDPLCVGNCCGGCRQLLDVLYKLHRLPCLSSDDLPVRERYRRLRRFCERAANQTPLFPPGECA